MKKPRPESSEPKRVLVIDLTHNRPMVQRVPSCLEGHHPSIEGGASYLACGSQSLPPYVLLLNEPSNLAYRTFRPSEAKPCVTFQPRNSCCSQHLLPSDSPSFHRHSGDTHRSMRNFRDAVFTGSLTAGICSCICIRICRGADFNNIREGSLENRR